MLDFLFAVDIQIFGTINSATDSTLPQFDIDSNCGCCTANCMELNANETEVLTFTRKTNAINYNCKLCNKCITLTDSIKDRGVLSDIKFIFRCNADYMFFHSLKMLNSYMH